MVALAKRIWRDEEGQSMVEYGLILALIAVVAIGVLTAIGTKVKGTYEKVDQALGTGSSGGSTP
ncbi:Flp family type IVb pilin [Desulfothermobacter acidiphilus]|uniref:Flp family type IVb pilin n=1 Tax=Desulfothermobacter acidiphilus TaxID=1938353 RepID=UPI003F899C99